ncbi:MAG TPA: nitrous oxide reductase accessory protein NosL [Candidatus Binatia bacterium]|nr:nitrous oxide reductase accessory protein NosL [Candidatus Binatia bacterium]
MRTLAVRAASAVAAVVLAVVFLWPSGQSDPEPIAHGRDSCARCRMIISQPGFGGELRDRKGALTKYDDLGCMLDAMLAERGEMPAAWVEDHRDGTLVPLLTASLVRTAAGSTPMGHGIVAFADAAAAGSFVAEHGGEAVALEEVVRSRERLALRTSQDEAGREP